MYMQIGIGAIGIEIGVDIDIGIGRCSKKYTQPCQPHLISFQALPAVLLRWFWHGT